MPPKGNSAHLTVVIPYYSLTQMQRMLIVLRELTDFLLCNWQFDGHNRKPMRMRFQHNMFKDGKS